MRWHEREETEELTMNARAHMRQRKRYNVRIRRVEERRKDRIMTYCAQQRSWWRRSGRWPWNPDRWGRTRRPYVAARRSASRLRPRREHSCICPRETWAPTSWPAAACRPYFSADPVIQEDSISRARPRVSRVGWPLCGRSSGRNRCRHRGRSSCPRRRCSSARRGSCQGSAGARDGAATSQRVFPLETDTGRKAPFYLPSLPPPPPPAPPSPTPPPPPPPTSAFARRRRRRRRLRSYRATNVDAKRDRRGDRVTIQMPQNRSNLDRPLRNRYAMTPR